MDSLIPYFDSDDRYCLLVDDMGFGVMDKLSARFPSRIINTGIMEPGATGIAAGMAMAGMIPIVYCIVNFLAFRAIEQIRNDVILQGLCVKFIGTGCNDYFKFLGPSHCCGTQDVSIMQMVGMSVYDPYTATESFSSLVDRWILSPAAGYIRV